MTAVPAPTPSTNQPITLPARRTTSAPSVAYRTAAGAARKLEIVSEVIKGPDARTVSTAPASASTVTADHATAVARREWVTGASPDPAPFSRSPCLLSWSPWLRPRSRAAPAVACGSPATAWLLGFTPPGLGVQVASDAQDEQPVKGVQAAVGRVVLPQPGEQALHQRGQQDQHGRAGDRAGARPGDQREHQDKHRDTGHREPERAMGREGIAARVKEAEHTQAGQEDLGRPGQQEGQQRPPVPEEGAAARSGDGCGGAGCGCGAGRGGTGRRRGAGCGRGAPRCGGTG